MFIVLLLTLFTSSPSFQGPREYPLPALFKKSCNDFVAGFLCFIWHKFLEMSDCRGIEVFRVQIMVLHGAPLWHGAMQSGVLCVVVVDVEKGYGACS